eukprot:853250-Ditylum_brightwellii.AAC.1
MENKQVLACSLARPVDESKINHQASQSGKILDPAVKEIEGSQPTLDLLLDLVSSSMPVADHSEINELDANEHIGFEFVHKDKCEVPTEAKVIKVDEDTGKVLLEYVHGGLELVELNIIQEVLLSRSQHEDEDYLWLFSKILNHRTVTNGEIEVEVMWDNKETSWEPLA